MDGVHADCAGACDISGEIVDKDGLLGGDRQTLEGNLVDPGIGFGHAYLSGNDNLVKHIGNLPCVLEHLAQIIPGIADEAGLVIRAQSANIVYQFLIQEITAPKIEGKIRMVVLG